MAERFLNTIPPEDHWTRKGLWKRFAIENLIAQ